MMSPSKRPIFAALGLATLLAVPLPVWAQHEDLDTDEQGLANDTDVEPDDDDADEDSKSDETGTPTGTVSAPADQPRKKSKGLVLESEDGRFKTQIQARVQTRYEYDLLTPDGVDDRSAFSIARGRITLKGHAFAENIEYKFQADWGKGNLSLKDFYVDYVRGGVFIRAGQFKRPFSRQQITSSGNQEFVDRAITDKAFLGERDIGIMIHNNYEKSPELEWAVGIFNATGDASVFAGVTDPDTGAVVIKPSNVPAFFGPALVARIGINRGGLEGYTEADLEGGPLRYGVAASVLSEFDADDDDASAIRAQLDYIVKVNGFSTTGGVYIATAQDGEGFADQSYDQIGYHIQAGYTVNGMHQVVGRYAMFDRDKSDPDQELTLGYSLYGEKHGFKWQTDAGLRTAEGKDLGDEVLLRSQLQLSF